MSQMTISDPDELAGAKTKEQIAAWGKR